MWRHLSGGTRQNTRLGQAGWLALLAVGPLLQSYSPAMMHWGLGQAYNGQPGVCKDDQAGKDFPSALQMSPISMGLQDGHHYVRRTAVLGVLKVYNLDASAVRNAGGPWVSSEGLQSWQLSAWKTACTAMRSRGLHGASSGRVACCQGWDEMLSEA